MKITKNEINDLAKSAMFLTPKAELLFVLKEFFPQIEEFEIHEEEFTSEGYYPTLQLKIKKVRIGIANIQGSCFVLTINFKHRLLIDYSVNNKAVIVKEFITSLGL